MEDILASLLQSFVDAVESGRDLQALVPSARNVLESRIRLCSWSTLPTELLTHCFQYLPQTVLVRTSRVSRHWSAASQQQLCCRPIITNPTMASRYFFPPSNHTRFRYLKHLDLSSVVIIQPHTRRTGTGEDALERKMIAALQGRCRQLRSLALNGVNLQSVALILDEESQLKVMSLERFHMDKYDESFLYMEPLLKALAKLESLKLRQCLFFPCKEHGAAMFHSVVKHLNPNLKTLRMCNMNHVLPSSLDLLVRRCKNVETLEIDGDVGKGSDEDMGILLRLQTPRNISISSSVVHNLSEKVVHNALAHPSLERLSTMLSTLRITASIFDTLVDTSRNLKALLLPRIHKVNQSALAAVPSRHPHLEAVQLPFSASDEVVVSFITHCRKLRHFGLACCSDVTDSVMRHIASDGTSLVSLSLSDTQVTIAACLPITYPKNCGRLKMVSIDSQEDLFARSGMEMTLTDLGVWKKLVKKVDHVGALMWAGFEQDMPPINKTGGLQMQQGRVGTPGGTPKKLVSRIVFDKYDVDRSGSIDAKEFRTLVYEFGYFLSDQELEMAVRILDVNGDGNISYEEFIQWWSKDQRFETLRLSPEDFENLNRAVKNFQKYDKNLSGVIDVKEFPALYKELSAHGLTTKGLAATLEDFDSNRDGKVSFNEFIQYFQTSVMRKGDHK
ncbi:hypothetical protein SmJEL517_g03565 [Synchytrium microbalum]|uniref:EF-hand domain-containing protein n=1 Tax=Synchytrium microbalum TaxID=1806994 RepID=A0A507C2D2_9FUNG|nr:uncharacterized protein SmJEL517_g03565 [Synchytrium microbalum]TPX33581.1 hypothetical protein SmJEL517_g03565 [Synchytrium microbalum]